MFLWRPICAEWLPLIWKCAADSSGWQNEKLQTIKMNPGITLHSPPSGQQQREGAEVTGVAAEGHRCGRLLSECKRLPSLRHNVVTEQHGGCSVALKPHGPVSNMVPSGTVAPVFRAKPGGGHYGKIKLFITCFYGFYYGLLRILRNITENYAPWLSPTEE